MSDFAPFASPYMSSAQSQDQGPNFSTIKLVDAIQNNWRYEHIVQIIQANPDGIHEKGWHGFTPMHRAALRGDPAIISLLLEHGGDINALNDYGETPLMYACKRGNSANIATMIEAGADLDIVDHQGRKAVHHAAAGGSVQTLHYLSEVQGITFEDRDKHGQTPLHVTCLQGFQDAVKYLLRKGRSDVMWKDNYGNLPIHIAALNALSETCWTLLEMSNCKTLLAPNKEGKTPLDILKEGRSLAHQYLYKELAYWSKSRAPHLPPRGPLSSWYSLLFGPFTGFATIVAVGSLLGDYSGVAISVLTAFLVFLVSNQHHRISHISRWANPVQAGAFAAGISHTIICYVYKVLPVLWPHTVNLQLVILIPALLVMLTLYYRLLTEDPGTCKVSQTAATSGGGPGAVLTINDLAKGRCKMDAFCVTCELIMPEDAKHCRMCRRCVSGFDHHCQFLLTCIGGRNHRHFVIFILLTTLMHISFVAHAALYLFQGHAQLEWWPFLMAVFYGEGWVCALIALNAISFLGNANLSRYQLNVVSYGLTTFEVISRSRRNLPRLSSLPVTRRVRLKNIMAFLMGRPPYAKYSDSKPKVFGV
ncbi:uncharacterized protein [Diadema antillarum]|uniref:uncharacterized protein n=1 Tax=Diadema antillarum TaxID=105358 RepID=UPI003A845D05